MEEDGNGWWDAVEDGRWKMEDGKEKTEGGDQGHLFPGDSAYGTTLGLLELEGKASQSLVRSADSVDSKGQEFRF